MWREMVVAVVEAVACTLGFHDPACYLDDDTHTWEWKCRRCRHGQIIYYPNDWEHTHD